MAVWFDVEANRSKVLHRARVRRKPYKLELACGGEVRLPDAGYYNLPFNDDALHQLQQLDRHLDATCSHCWNREPPWERRQRLKRRRRGY